jgi:hypothetical protein
LGCCSSGLPLRTSMAVRWGRGRGGGLPGSVGSDTASSPSHPASARSKLVALAASCHAFKKVEGEGAALALRRGLRELAVAAVM